MDVEKYLSGITVEFEKEFSLFENMLSERNKVCNLTSVRDGKGVLYRHFLDSVVGEGLFPQGAKVADIGAGGGFPSIPIKILRKDLSFTLIESTGKKCAFLNDVVERLGLDGVKVLNIRAEDGARNDNLRERFDAACARAVAPLNVLCEYCLPYVKVGGIFVAYKGKAEEEIKNAAAAIEILGGALERAEEYELPECGERTLVVIRKVKSTPERYPRGQGRERKNPL